MLLNLLTGMLHNIFNPFAPMLLHSDFIYNYIDGAERMLCIRFFLVMFPLLMILLSIRLYFNPLILKFRYFRQGHFFLTSISIP